MHKPPRQPHPATKHHAYKAEDGRRLTCWVRDSIRHLHCLQGLLGLLDLACIPRRAGCRKDAVRDVKHTAPGILTGVMHSIFAQVCNPRICATLWQCVLNLLPCASPSASPAGPGWSGLGKRPRANNHRPAPSLLHSCRPCWGFGSPRHPQLLQSMQLTERYEASSHTHPLILDRL